MLLQNVAPIIHLPTVHHLPTYKARVATLVEPSSGDKHHQPSPSWLDLLCVYLLIVLIFWMKIQFSLTLQSTLRVSPDNSFHPALHVRRVMLGH